MKFKYYLRGLGLGIIFTVLVLTISGNHNKSDSSNVPPASEQDIKEKDVIKNDIDNSEQNKDSEISDKISTSSNQVEPSSENPSDEISQEATEKSSERHTITFTIKNGQYCWTVSEELQKLGIIENAADFRKFMKQKGYVDEIRTGTFEIPTDATYEEIAQILMKNE